jgi:hypothetical protein
MKVTASRPEQRLGNGTAWIDAERFIPLKGEYAPAKLPKRVTWMKLQTQHGAGPGGLAVPTLLKLEGAGQAFFVRKGFSSTFRWKQCRTDATRTGS